MKTNYVLIDYENVQPSGVDLLNHEHFKVIVFVGANQTKITFEIAAALQQMGTRAQYIRVTGNGMNALDFHIAFYVGQLAAHEPDAYFHIISKDTGFDPLIQHLKSKKVRVTRVQDVPDIHCLKTTQAERPSDKLAAIVTDLRQRGAAKPRSVKTLSSTINAIFQKKLSEQELASLVDGLRKQGFITITDTKVSYALPT